MEERDLTVAIHGEDGQYWAEVVELPGCFATGDSIEEVREALGEAIALYLDWDGVRMEWREADPAVIGVKVSEPA